MRKYKCHICGKEFDRITEAIVHIRGKHNVATVKEASKNVDVVNK
jgi:NMD protein affecting ribosome stability and mRNA decay